jgi:DNA topoisomerase III
VEHRRRVPPRLFDLLSPRKTCGQRWGWTADKTLAIGQELYDGEGKKVITYPRGRGPPSQREPDRRPAGHRRRHDPARGFAHLEINRPVIRRGKFGHFCDKALDGAPAVRTDLTQ